MPKERRFEFRVTDEELKVWRAESSEAGMLLSQWIRELCNGNQTMLRADVVQMVGGSANDGGGLAGVQAASQSGDITTVDKAPRKLRECAHGTPKGFRCWQCGGIAKVE